jgi:hypothetical protein
MKVTKEDVGEVVLHPWNTRSVGEMHVIPVDDM